MLKQNTFPEYSRKLSCVTHLDGAYYIIILTAYSAAAGKAELKHNQHKHINFDELSKLDKELCELCIEINSCWNKIYFRIRFGKHSNKIHDGVAFLSKNIITTGSTMEYSVSCRSLTSEKIEVELDQLLCLGKIDKDVVSNALASVKNHPGFFRLKTSSWEYMFPFFKDYQTFACFCPQSKDGREVLKEAVNLFSLQNEYVMTSKLRKLVGKVTQGGIQDPDNVTISGPASTTQRNVNRSIEAVLKIYFPSLKIVEYNALSLNDIIKTEGDSFIKVSEDLDELYFKAFPRDDKNINTLYLHQLIVQLTRKGINEVDMIQLVHLIQKMGYIPYAPINEFGYLYIDHVPSIHLSFWPDIASNWPVREPRYWPNKETVEKIISNGCHIVPKSPRGESNNEWRISFSAAELGLSQTLTQFQRKCFLVAKLIYYVVIKRIDPDVFASYFLKTVMFKLLEKQPCLFWKNSTLTEVIHILFNNLSCCFEKKVLTSFFVKDLNLLERIESEKLRFASIESAAVSEYPLAFLPEDFDQKLQLLKKCLYFSKRLANGMKIFYDMIPFMYLLTNDSLTWNLLRSSDATESDW